LENLKIIVKLEEPSEQFGDFKERRFPLLVLQLTASPWTT